MHNDTFWSEQSQAIRDRLAGQSANFVQSASLQEIQAVGGEEFTKQSENTQQAIIAVMRQHQPS